ncbi:MAG: hypothetical protein ACLFXM_10710, partial [Acidimicrobiia bacterium]
AAPADGRLLPTGGSCRPRRSAAAIARGFGFRRVKGEAMGSGSGTDDLGLAVAEPMTSGFGMRWRACSVGVREVELMTSG